MRKISFLNKSHTSNFTTCINKYLSTGQYPDNDVSSALYLIGLAAIENEELITEAFDYEKGIMKINCLDKYRISEYSKNALLLANNLLTGTASFKTHKLRSPFFLFSALDSIYYIEAIKIRFDI